jgi:hypothetical protein
MASAVKSWLKPEARPEVIDQLVDGVGKHPVLCASGPHF